MDDIELVKSLLLDQYSFTFTVIHNCVSLYDKSNASKIHRKALGGEDKAIEILNKIEAFNTMRLNVLRAYLKKYKNNCLETLLTYDLVEEYDIKDKSYLVCSKKRGTTKAFVIPKETIIKYKAFFYLQNFEKIIKETYLGYIKKQDKKIAILSILTFTMWETFSKHVITLLDQI